MSLPGNGFLPVRGLIASAMLLEGLKHYKSFLLVS